MDDEDGRPRSIIAGARDEPSLERAVVRSRDGDVFRLERQVRRCDLETGPPDTEEPGESPGRGPAHPDGEDCAYRDAGEDTHRPSFGYGHAVARVCRLRGITSLLTVSTARELGIGG